MNRRSFLGAMTSMSVLGTAGCIGGGGDLVVELKKVITVQPNSGWIKEIPDVSDPGGAISYIAMADKPFDVYFFVGTEQRDAYKTYLRDNAREPAVAGNEDIGTTAVEEADDEYVAATDDKGARQQIGESGPYFFVLDHSNYPVNSGAMVRPNPEPRSVDLDLTVSKKRFGL